MARVEQYDPDQMVQAAHDQSGDVQAMSRAIGCGARTIYRYMDRYERVKEAVRAARSSTYSEVVSIVKAAALGEEGGGSIDQQWAAKKILETYGETVEDGLTWTSKQRVEHVENLGITILPSDGTPVRDSNTAQALQDGAVRDVLPADTQG